MIHRHVLNFFRPAKAFSSQSYRDIKHSDLVLQKTNTAELKKKTPYKELVFGRTFTDHMLVCSWQHESSASTVDSLGQSTGDRVGWSAPSIQKYGPFQMAPSAMVFHYGLEIFEGMKAYKDAQGRIRLFRPMKNMERLAASAQRLSLPSFDGKELLECIKELVRVDADWIPDERGYSLYIRPTMIGTQDTLGVAPANRALFFTIMSPVGPYYKTGFSAVSLIAEEKYVRAWPGGTGASKIGGNYAPGILPQVKANEAGFQQILWLFGPDALITEVGTMNLFIFWENEQHQLELVTPPLDGTILPGVTRDSVLALTRSWNEFAVTERKVTMHDLTKAIKEGRVREMFGAGTAAIVSPIKSIHWRGNNYSVPLDPTDTQSQAGPLTKRLSSTIMDIQYGVKDFENWSEVL